MKRILMTSIVAIGVAFGILSTLTPGASAQEGGSLIIGVSQCPEGYDGQDFATDCVDPAVDVEFFIATPNTDNTASSTTGGDGLVTFNLEQFDLDPTGPDSVVVGEPATQTSDFAVSCTVNDGQTLDFVTQDIPFEPGGPLLGIAFDFETGDDIACEWYRITLPMPGDDPPVDDAGDELGGVEVEDLPNTGVGASAPGGLSLLGLVAVTAMLASVAAAAASSSRRLVR
jgi:hypothetical protein